MLPVIASANVQDAVLSRSFDRSVPGLFRDRRPDLYTPDPTPRA
jgi:hypothetical protein